MVVQHRFLPKPAKLATTYSTCLKLSPTEADIWNSSGQSLASELVKETNTDSFLSPIRLHNRAHMVRQIYLMHFLA